MCKYHHPVMLRESVDALNIRPDGVYVDATFGGGGHSCAILDQLKEGRLYAFDCDIDAAKNAPKDDRFVFIHNNFKYMQNCLRYAGCTSVDGILADLGVSSHQFDTGERGFSFRFDTPLDMRMNQNSDTTAAHILNTYNKEALARIFSLYGEMPLSERAAALIIEARTHKPIQTTGDLQSALRAITPHQQPHKFWATLYQSLRIEVNREIEALEALLVHALHLLNSSGRLVIITYHSLEDRLVKNFMRSGNSDGVVSHDFYGNKETPFMVVTKKAITPSIEETTQNNRARSAKLRVAQKR